MSTEARVAVIPKCDFCRHPSGGRKEVPAQYDFKTRGGAWAYGCEEHWKKYRFYPDLGTGKGQKLVKA